MLVFCFYCCANTKKVVKPAFDSVVKWPGTSSCAVCVDEIYAIVLIWDLGLDTNDILWLWYHWRGLRSLTKSILPSFNMIGIVDAIIIIVQYTPSLISTQNSNNILCNIFWNNLVFFILVTTSSSSEKDGNKEKYQVRMLLGDI